MTILVDGCTLYLLIIQNYKHYYWPLNRSSVNSMELTEWKRVLSNKERVSQLNKKFSDFYEHRLFINAFARASDLSMFLGISVQSWSSFSLGSILILYFLIHLGLPSGFYVSKFPTEACMHLSSLSYVPYSAPNSFFSILSPGFYLARSTYH
jgi:hypothetical protein